MEHVRTAALIVSTLTMGLAAGVFGIYANAIMPGLRDTDDRTFVGAFQSIDEAIVNPLFMSVFVGALLATGLTAGLHLGADERSRLPWLLAAFMLYLAVFVITIGINVPLNDDIKAAGDRTHRAAPPHRRARAVRRGAVGPLERGPRGCDRGGVRLPDLGARSPRTRHDVGRDGESGRLDPGCRRGEDVFIDVEVGGGVDAPRDSPDRPHAHRAGGERGRADRCGRRPR